MKIAFATDSHFPLEKKESAFRRNREGFCTVSTQASPFSAVNSAHTLTHTRTCTYTHARTLINREQRVPRACAKIVSRFLIQLDSNCSFHLDFFLKSNSISLFFFSPHTFFQYVSVGARARVCVCGGFFCIVLCDCVHKSQDDGCCGASIS